MSRYGQYHVAETPSSLMRLHFHKGGPLTIVDHEPKVAVLDQSDLIAQGIDTSQLIPGAKTVDALGSCTAQATTAAISNVLGESAFLHQIEASTYADAKAAEEWAIRFYHQTTDLTGDPAQEWPPTDCGSSGQYIVRELQAQKMVTTDRIAHGADNIVSLMQTDGLLVGQPFLNAWEEPNAAGFIDGDGSHAALEAALRSGVAGGHETYWSAIESLSLTASGHVIPGRTVVRARNSWGTGWGDHGSYRFHLSTFMALGSHCDFRQLVA